MRQMKKLPEVKTFLDVGCGAGDLSCLLAQEFDMSGVGIDFSQDAINTADKLKKYYGIGSKLKFQLVDGNIPKTTKKADVVICLEVLEHVKQDNELLRDLVSFSKRYVIISVPAKQTLFTHSDKLAGHFRRYEKTDLEKLLARNGLSTIAFISYGYPFTNLIRLARERVAKKRQRPASRTSRETGTKKSGVDLMDVNKYFALPLEQILLPLCHVSRLFNSFDLSEGYLVIAEKA